MQTFCEGSSISADMFIYLREIELENDENSIMQISSCKIQEKWITGHWTAIR
uniref:Uncharacterized protein n=1 Tax=Arundo donax TaxID=35708 RepID=A0A0A9EU51_ARUDO